MIKYVLPIQASQVIAEAVESINRMTRNYRENPVEHFIEAVIKHTLNNDGSLYEATPSICYAMFYNDCSVKALMDDNINAVVSRIIEILDAKPVQRALRPLLKIIQNDTGIKFKTVRFTGRRIIVSFSIQE